MTAAVCLCAMYAYIWMLRAKNTCREQHQKPLDIVGLLLLHASHSAHALASCSVLACALSCIPTFASIELASAGAQKQPESKLRLK
jgi:hypothetical protein